MDYSISILDYLILIILLGVIYSFAYWYRNNNYPIGHPYRKYLITGLSLKIIGALVISLIYQIVYKGGDTLNFFKSSLVINSAFNESPLKWFNLLFHLKEEYAIGYYNYTSQISFYNDPGSYFVIATGAFFSLLVFNTFLPTVVLFAALSFTGIWAFFKTFASIYPSHIKSVAISFLFIPSVIVWGSGIFKDTICIFALGWLTYSIFQMLIKRNFSIGNIFIAATSFYTIYVIKIYIIIAFLPAIFLWILFVYTQSIRDIKIRIFAKYTTLLFAILAIAFVFYNLGETELGAYSFKNIEQTSTATRNWISYSSGDEGSTYDLGKITNGPEMLLKLPAAINVTLFRPYIWESKKLIMLFSAFEAFLFLFLTIKVIIIVGPKKIWNIISSDHAIQFSLIFSLIFAFAVGISTYNFGSLSRYKIPSLPFYSLALLLIYYKNQPSQKKLFKILNI